MGCHDIQHNDAFSILASRMIDLIVTYLIRAAIHTYTCLIKGATTFRKMTFSILAFSIIDLFVTLI
jgi:hypothetical protein